MKCLIGKGPSSSSYVWNKDGRHRRQAKLLGIFESIWPENGGSLPWRLTSAQRNILEARMSRIIWPHYIERMYYKGMCTLCNVTI